MFLFIISVGIVTTIAGYGANSSIDGTALSAAFAYPMGITVDSLGQLFVIDYNSYRIRKITPTGKNFRDF